MKKIKIIVVDDHQLFRNGLESLLRGNIDFEVLPGTDNKRDLLKALKENEIDLVLLDISLANDSGLSILDELQAQHPDLKCIMLTMHEEIRYVKESLRKGAAGYLLKETGEKELHEAIYSVYQGKKHFKNKISDLLIEDMSSKTTTKILTDREIDIVRMVADGKITKEIADDLHISVRTVETHRSKIMKKLGAANASEMIKAALDKKLI